MLKQQSIKEVWLFFLLLCLLNPLVTIAQTKRIFEISTANLCIKIDPSYGGRVTSLTINQDEMLINKNSQPANFGSTLWPSPQSDWGWPPSKNLDIMPYKVLEASSKSMEIQSENDTVSGYQFTKKFCSNDADSSFIIVYTIRNISASQKIVAPWEITRVSSGGIVFFSKGAEKCLDKSDMTYNDTLNTIWYTAYEHKLIKSQKLFYHARGWIAHCNNGILFLKTFPDFPPSQSAPNEEEVELYVSNDFPYMEIENQGLFTKLAPGGSLQWIVTWYVRQLPAALKDIHQPSSILLKYVKQNFHLN